MDETDYCRPRFPVSGPLPFPFPGLPGLSPADDPDELLTPAIVDGIQKHAIAAWPSECCGLIVGTDYRPCKNVYPDPSKGFRVAPAAYDAAARAVVHSHVNGRRAPSAIDMAGQMDSGVPWVIVVTDGREAGRPWAWGDSLPLPALVGRSFRHGPTGTDGRGDCYALIRDFYRMVFGVMLRDFPRDDNWWGNGGDLYRQLFPAAGFRQVPPAEARPGDVFLAAIPGGGGVRGVPHHGGIIEAGGKILHHLPGRYSRREPMGRWRKFMTHFLRYEAKGGSDG